MTTSDGRRQRALRARVRPKLFKIWRSPRSGRTSARRRRLLWSTHENKLVRGRLALVDAATQIVAPAPGAAHTPQARR